MQVSNRIKVFSLVSLVAGLFCSLCFADEILFQNQRGPQQGTIVQEDEHTVTIRFPKESIKSINRDQGKVATPSPEGITWEEKDNYLILKIPRQTTQLMPPGVQTGGAPTKQEPSSPIESPAKEKMLPSEEQASLTEKPGALPIPSHSKGLTTQEKLLQEEMGRVQGVIQWKEKPLDNGKVKIVLERYTGFSVAALKNVFKGEKEGKSEEVSLLTQTDSQGRYSFSQVPPGQYRLYWQPVAEAGWFHRFREEPDFEVTAGSLIVQNIPEKKK